PTRVSHRHSPRGPGYRLRSIVTRLPFQPEWFHEGEFTLGVEQDDLYVKTRAWYLVVLGPLMRELSQVLRLVLTPKHRIHPFGDQVRRDEDAQTGGCMAVGVAAKRLTHAGFQLLP